MPASLFDPLTLFIAQAIVIVVVARLLGWLARRSGQPMVMAEIVAGILLGPSLLGLVSPALEGRLFPKQSLSLLDIMSQVGLILFMFLIGLELDPKQLRGRAKSSVAISYASIVLPFALGALLALYLFPRLAPPGVPVASFVLFMGAAMSITAFPVLARILVERRLLRSRVGAVAIASAALGDVTAWCIVAFVLSIARSDSIGGAVLTTSLAVVFIAVMLGVVRPFLNRLADRTSVGLTQNLFAVVLVLLLLSSWATELIGIHALFGAFLFGSILPKHGSFAAALAEKVEDLVVVLLLPLFFAYSGLRTEIGLLDSADAWLVCGLVIAVACVGKLGGSAIAARMTGMRWREAGAIGVLMNTRGLMELIVLNVGLDMGVISPKLFTMMVVMALVTTFMTTPLLQRIYPLEELVRQLAVAEPEPPSQPATAHPYTALVCVSLDSSGPGLVTVAAAITGDNAERSRLYALRLIPAADRASFVLAQRERDSEPGGTQALAPLLARAQALGARVRPLSFVSSDPSRDICDVVEVKQADLVLLGWHQPLLGAAMLGGTVHEVMADAKADVAVLVDRGVERLQRILVPYLGSEHDQAALTLAKRIGENVGAAVTVLHVVMPDRKSAKLDAQRQVREQFREHGAARSYDVHFKAVPHTAPSDAVVEESRRGYDLVLIGAGREWGLEHRSFGRKREAILTRCPTSVMVVRRAAAVEVVAEVPAAEQVVAVS